MRQAVPEEARLIVQVCKRIAQHRVDPSATTFGWGVAHLWVTREVVKVPLNHERMNRGLLSKRVERVLVCGVEERLADVKQHQLNIRTLAFTEELLHESDFEIAVAWTECNHLERSIFTERHSTLRKLGLAQTIRIGLSYLRVRVAPLRLWPDSASLWAAVAREAAEKGIGLEVHATHLIVHGTLHLVGYDHMDDAAAAAMEALEVKALASLGIANPYADQD